MEEPANYSTTQETGGPSEESVLRLSRVFDATQETLFQAFTDPAILVRWWGPEGVTIPECHVDLRVGGSWRTCMEGSDCEQNCVGGVYREINPPERLAFTWAWDAQEGRGEETLVTLEFREHADGCELIFTQEGFTNNAVRDRHNEGWSSSFVCLRKILADENAR